MIAIAEFAFKYWKQVIIVAVIAGLWYHGYTYGKDSVEHEYQKKALEYQAAMRHLGDEYEKAKAERQIVTKTKVKTIYVEADPTGCADAPALSGVLGALRSDSD